MPDEMHRNEQQIEERIAVYQQGIMKSIRLIFGTHNSLPFAGDTGLIESVYQKALKPFLTVLNRFPGMSVVLHYSGYLLEWLEKAHPEFIMLLADMVGRKQVELLTGGYYEPVLTIIPNADRLGQIEHLTTFLRGRFGKRPRGGWISQCDWEPFLASTLANVGVEYTFLDESHFRHSGVTAGELGYRYLTEDQGKTVSVFPLSQKLKRLVFTAPPEEVVKHIVGSADESSGRLLAFMGGGESFGYVGRSHDRYIKENWLEEFCRLVMDKSDVIVPAKPAKLVKQQDPRAKVYISYGASSEVADALLPSEKAHRAAVLKKKNLPPHLEALLAGATFRQFLCRYPESGFMYAKMMHTHIRVNQIRGDKYRKIAARKELWRGQANFGYWHSSKGGLYWPQVRKEQYRAFIEAEKMTRADGTFTPSIISFDFDSDGRNEYVFQGRDINAYIHSSGGMLFELDHIPSRWNYGDSLSRWPELYHQNGDRIYDGYTRKSFIDHFLPEGVDLGAFQVAAYRELGNFVDQEYELYRMNRDRRELTLVREGSITVRNRAYPLRIVKKYIFRRLSLSVEYVVTNRSEQLLDLRFAAELNLSLPSSDGKNPAMFAFEKAKRIRVPAGPNSREAVGKVLLQDSRNGVDITFASDQPSTLWSLPLVTVSRSFGMREENYQATCFVPHWSFPLAHNESWTNKLTLSFARRGKQQASA